MSGPIPKGVEIKFSQTVQVGEVGGFQPLWRFLIVFSLQSPIFQKNTVSTLFKTVTVSKQSQTANQKSITTNKVKHRLM